MRRDFEAVYSEEQREAFTIAYVDGGMTAKEVIAAAKAGLLKHNGKPLGAFTINSEHTIRSYAKELKKRRTGKVKSELAQMPAQDAREAARRRSWNAWDALMRSYEGTLRTAPQKADPKRFSEIVKAGYDISRWPGPTEPARPSGVDRNQATGQKERRLGNGTGKIMGALLKADRESPRTAQDTSNNTKDNGESRRETPKRQLTADNQGQSGPFSRASEQIRKASQ